MFKPYMLFSPDDGEGSSAEMYEELSPRDMLLRDFESGEVGEQYESDTQADNNTNLGADLTPDEVGEAVLVGEQITNPPEAEVTSPSINASDLNKLREDIFGKLAEITKAREEQQPATQPEEVKPEEPAVPELSDEELMEQYYADPLKTLRMIESNAEAKANKKVEEQITGLKNQFKPYQDQLDAAMHQQKIREVITDFVNNTADGRECLTDMTQFINANHLAADDPQSYKDAYREVKIGRLMNENNQLRASQGKSFEDYMADEAYRNKVLEDKGIQDAIINKYLNELQNGKRPATISSGGSATPVGQEANKPASIRDAGRFLRDQL